MNDCKECQSFAAFAIFLLILSWMIFGTYIYYQHQRRLTNEKMDSNNDGSLHGALRRDR